MAVAGYKYSNELVVLSMQNSATQPLAFSGILRCLAIKLVVHNRDGSLVSNCSRVSLEIIVPLNQEIG